MAFNTGDPQSHALEYQPLFIEAERLSEHLEHALLDPSANTDDFFQTLDRYADVLTTLEVQREALAPVYVKH